MYQGTVFPVWGTKFVQYSYVPNSEMLVIWLKLDLALGKWKLSAFHTLAFDDKMLLAIAIKELGKKIMTSEYCEARTQVALMSKIAIWWGRRRYIVRGALEIVCPRGRRICRAATESLGVRAYSRALRLCLVASCKFFEKTFFYIWSTKYRLITKIITELVCKSRDEFNEAN